MKRKIIPILVALLIAVLITTPVFANDTNVIVEASEITIEGETASGTVTITCEAEADSGFINTAWASSNAWYEVYLGSTLQESGNSPVASSDSGWFWSPASADASQTFEWTYEMTDCGEYYFLQGGEGEADFSTIWPTSSGGSDADSESDLTVVREPEPFAGDAPSWYPNKSMFYLWFGGLFDFNWVDGNALPFIDQQSDGYWNSIPYNLRVVIPEGTEVTGGYCLQLVKNNGGFTFRNINGTPMAFSNPVTIYQMIDGEWVEIASQMDF